MSVKTEEAGQEQTNEQKPEQQPEPGIRLTTEQLAERLERERRTYLKKLGFESEEALRATQEALRKSAQEEEERKRAQMSEIERYRADLEAEQRSRAKIEQEYAAAQFEARVTKLCVSLGIRNIEYAMFEVIRATEQIEEGETVDIAAHLKSLAEDQNKRAALGMAAAEQTETTRSPVTTSPKDPAVAAPPTPNQARPPQDAFGMDQAAWMARKAALGLP